MPRVVRWCLSGASKLLPVYSRVLYSHSHRLCIRIHTTTMKRPQKRSWQRCASSLHPKLIWVLVSCFVCDKERQLDMWTLFLWNKTRDLNLNRFWYNKNHDCMYRLRTRTTSNRNCPWVSVSLSRTRFMAPAAISVGSGIHRLTVRVWGRLRFPILQSSSGMVRTGSKGNCTVAVRPLVSLSRMKHDVEFVVMIWFFAKRHRGNDPFFAYNIHDIVFYFQIVFHSIMTSGSVAVRVYLSVLFIFLYYVWTERSRSTHFDLNYLGF